MSREEEEEFFSETPRRRAKRERVITSKYDSDMYDTNSRAPMYHEEEITTTGAKRKRVKKARGDDDDDEWVPDRIAPLPPRRLREYDVRSDELPHAHQHQHYHDNVYDPPLSSAPRSMSTSVFQDVPVMIESFSEVAERRRSSANGNGNVPLKINTHESNFNHSAHVTPRNGFPVRITHTHSTRSQTEPSMSVMNLFYPDYSISRSERKGRKQGESAIPGRESKRRRRSDTSRSSRSRNSQDDGPEQDVYDMLQFGVDAVKLIPQGLVDRIDPKMRGDFASVIIISHVENWSRRAGFGGIVNNFVHELATLLTAYYPCTYPTLLDEVLTTFAFKRPELLAPLLRPMIDKILKMGEMATPGRYPIIDSLARKCNLLGTSDRSRHNLSCLTLLQCLVEQNIEPFCLTPWILACVSSCTRKVHQSFWEHIIRSSTKNSTAENEWRIYKPCDQIVEILKFDCQQGSECSSSVSLIRTFLFSNDLHRVENSVKCEAFKTVFGFASVHTCSQLLHDWFDKLGEAHDGDDATAIWMKILDALISNCSQLSVRETTWFVKRVLQNVISQPHFPIATFKTLLVQNPELFLGFADTHDLEEIKNWKESQPLLTVAVCGGVTDGAGAYEEELTTMQLRTLINVLRNGQYGVLFMSVWSDAWVNTTPQGGIILPWCYVWAIVRFCVLEIVPNNSLPIEKLLLEFAEQICVQYFAWLLRADQEPLISITSIRIKQVFDLVLTTSHSFGQLVLERMLHTCSSSAFATKQVFSNVVISHIAYSREPKMMLNHNHGSSSCIGMLKALAQLAKREDTIGDYVQELLTSRPLFHVMISIISSGSNEEASIVLDTFTNAINRSEIRACEFGTPIIELLVESMFRTNQEIVRNAGLLLEAIAYKFRSLAKSTLWCLLHICGKYCGVYSQEVDKHSNNVKDSVAVCADLFLSILMSQESGSVDVVASEILCYIQHRMAPCVTEGLGCNFFLAQVLLRLIQSGYGAKSLSILRYITLAFERKSGNHVDEILVLEILQAFSIELRSMCPNICTEWSIGVSLLCSVPVRNRLQELATQSTYRTSAMLAKMILNSCVQLKMQTNKLASCNSVINAQSIIEGC